MHSHLQLLGAGSRDGGGSILLFFDERRYLFNCGEGTQRFCGQHQIRLSKLAAVFLTRLEWDHVGGLPGMICTLADSGGVDALSLVGPCNTSHFVGSLRPFLRRSAFTLSITEAVQDGILYQDDFIKVQSFELLDAPLQESPKSRKTHSLSSPSARLDFENLSVDCSQETPQKAFVLKMFKDHCHYEPKADCSNLDTSATENSTAGLHKEQRPDHQRDNDRMPTVSNRCSSLCLTVESLPVPGKFDALKAKALGVPFGPLNGRLSRGEKIVLGDGRTIFPSDCISPATPGSIFLIIDVLTHGQMDDLERKLELMLKDRICLVLHHCPPDLFKSKRYQTSVLGSFAETVQHVWINGKSDSLVFPASFDLLNRLHLQVDPCLFAVPFFDTPIPADLTHKSVLVGRSLDIFRWHPRRKIDLVDTIQSDALQLPRELPPLARHHSYRPTPENPIVSFLGTGAALPGKYRNVSATLVDFGDCAYLLDCGEATNGQLFRRFGPELYLQVLARLRSVIISHLHADHQLGCPGLLSFLPRPLLIVAPSRYRTFLEEYAECADLGNTFDFIQSEDVTSSAEYRQQATVRLGLSLFEAVPVIHCPLSFGYVLKHPSGVQIVYSGDTRPCLALASAGLGADILIHEATFCDCLQAEAIEKRHSTISEAIKIGEQMEAKYTLLTHISQRYAKTVPPFDWESTPTCLPVFDLLYISLEQLASYNLPDTIRQIVENLPPESVEAAE